MNYRHAFHAGNFADVIKHALLVACLSHLQKKPKPFLVVDTHAGSGAYPLDGPEAGRTGEWEGGIGRLMHTDTPKPALLSELALAVTHLRGSSIHPSAYPGSPCLIRMALRDQDRAILAERHPEECEALRQSMAGDARVAIIEGDGYAVLRKRLPPVIRRGLILIDPPFEDPEEFKTLSRAVIQAHEDWPEALALIWYPLKDEREAARFEAEIESALIPEALCLNLHVGRKSERLRGCGLLLIAPPHDLPARLDYELPAIVGTLKQDEGASFSLRWLGAPPA